VRVNPARWMEPSNGTLKLPSGFKRPLVRRSSSPKTSTATWSFGLKIYPAGALTPEYGLGAEAADGGNLEPELEGSDVVVPGVICPSKIAGCKRIASRAGNHGKCTPALKRSKPWLESNRCPNAHLIIIETEEGFVTAVLAAEVVGADIQISGD
jgi:hypothetical protein